jgi:hypothetical protein
MANQHNPAPTMATSNHDSESYSDKAEDTVLPGVRENVRRKESPVEPEGARKTAMTDTGGPDPDPDSADLDLSQPVVDTLDPFHPDNFRLDQAYLKKSVGTEVLTECLVRKGKSQEWFRVHPSPAYRLDTALVQLQSDKNNLYIIPRPMIKEFQEGEYFEGTLYTAINRQNTQFIYWARHPDDRDNKWHTSGITTAEHAMQWWTNMKAVKAGYYHITKSNGDPTDPVWPTYSLHELLKVAFKNRIIDRPDHPAILVLRDRA